MSTEPSAPSPVPETVAVIGLGLMGGSLARALAALDPRPRVIGWSPDVGEREAALAEGVLDSAPESPEEAVEDVDLVAYAAPLEATLALIREHAGVWRAGCVVTDVASLKAPVLETARALGLADRYAGSHPMCGGEASGWAASRPDLYRGARVWMCADQRGPGTTVEAMWTALGALPATADASSHDRTMVLASHVPQFAATALAALLEDSGVGADALGPGGSDMTRLASSSPGVWLDLARHAGAALPEALRAYADGLSGLAAAIEDRDLEALEELMERTARWRGAGS